MEKLIYGIRSQDNGYPWQLVNGKDLEGLLGADCILSHNLVASLWHASFIRIHQVAHIFCIYISIKIFIFKNVRQGHMRENSDKKN